MPPIALIRRPGPLLADGLVTHIERVPVDVALALRQWETYVAALEAAGWDLVEVPPADHCPDAVFVEDTVVMYRNVAVISRPGADERQPEILETEKALESLGCSMNRIHGPGTLDGGDVLKVGDTVYVGRGGRTNAEG
jgi:dimethylargininase